jgi:hypothetical protein
MKPIIGAKKRSTPSATMLNIKITITAPVKNKTVGTNITKATIISVDNDNIKAMNNRINTNTKANPKNMKNANIIKSIAIGIVIIINGDTNNANSSKKGSPSKRNGRNIMKTKPRPNNIKGLNMISSAKSPADTKAPIAKNVPKVRNNRVPTKKIVISATPTNTNEPASMNGRNITNNDNRKLNINVATIENAIIGNDKKNIPTANPIQATKVTPANTIVAVINEP